MMTRLVRDFVQIEDKVSLDRMIDLLSQARAALPQGSSDVTVKLRGDDLFGHRLTISFLRPQTSEEADLDARYERPVRAVA